MSIIETATRFDELAKSKPVPQGYVEDRRSVYWVDKLPLQPPTVFDVSPRLKELVKSKAYHKLFVPDRPSPIREVSRSALHYPEKPRLKTLARPKVLHKQFVPDRPVQSIVSVAAMTTSPTKRLYDLARPKTYDRLLIKSNSSWEWGAWKSDVPKEALSHSASARLETLAESKKLHSLYQDNRPVQWFVSDAARNTQPTTRQHQLARPKTRTPLDQDYDGYKVSYAARNALASPRVSELALPVPRKQRAKKNIAS